MRTATKSFALDDLGLELLRLGADLRPLDVMFGQVAVELGIAGIVVVLPAGGQEEVHDVQAEAEVAGAGLLVEQAAGGDAADVALLANLRLQGVGVDLDGFVVLLDQDFLVVRGGGQRQDEKQQRGGQRAHG